MKNLTAQISGIISAGVSVGLLVSCGGSGSHGGGLGPAAAPMAAETPSAYPSSVPDHISLEAPVPPPTRKQTLKREDKEHVLRILQDYQFLAAPIFLIPLASESVDQTAHRLAKLQKLPPEAQMLATDLQANCRVAQLPTGAMDGANCKLETQLSQNLEVHSVLHDREGNGVQNQHQVGSSNEKMMDFALQTRSGLLRSQSDWDSYGRIEIVPGSSRSFTTYKLKSVLTLLNNAEFLLTGAGKSLRTSGGMSQQRVDLSFTLADISGQLSITANQPNAEAPTEFHVYLNEEDVTEKIPYFGEAFFAGLP